MWSRLIYTHGTCLPGFLLTANILAGEFLFVTQPRPNLAVAYTGISDMRSSGQALKGGGRADIAQNIVKHVCGHFRKNTQPFPSSLFALLPRAESRHSVHTFPLVDAFSHYWPRSDKAVDSESYGRATIDKDVEN